MKTKARALIALCLLLVGCDGSHVTKEELLQARDLEEFNKHAAAARSLGADAIPLFTAVIEDSLASKYNLLSYGKLNSSISHIHELASRGVYEPSSVSALIRAIEEQPAIDDTLVTADTLRMITGVDVGYDAEFVSSYTNSDEGKRREMIAKWKEWSQAHVSTP